MGTPTQTWNILFPLKTINQVRERADEIGTTPAGLVRTAIDMYLKEPEKAAHIIDNPPFMEGVRMAADIIKSEVKQPRFPSGQTFGDRLAEKIMNRINEEIKKETEGADD